MLAELREAGLPEDCIKYMHAVDALTLDPDEIGDPYPCVFGLASAAATDLLRISTISGASGRPSPYHQRPTLSNQTTVNSLKQQ
jgi:hypothetical protein